ncbi:MAG: hypothetical protein ACTSRA_21460 [Promethearchaeota archaeon]
MDRDELAEKIENGELTIDDIVDFFKVLAEVASESEEIQDEVEGWDRVLVFDVEDGPKVTLTVKDGKFACQEAYMAGDLKVTGPLPDAIKFRTITELIREELEE